MGSCHCGNAVHSHDRLAGTQLLLTIISRFLRSRLCTPCMADLPGRNDPRPHLDLPASEIFSIEILNCVSLCPGNGRILMSAAIPRASTRSFQTQYVQEQPEESGIRTLELLRRSQTSPGINLRHSTGELESECLAVRRFQFDLQGIRSIANLGLHN